MPPVAKVERRAPGGWKEELLRIQVALSFQLLLLEKVTPQAVVSISVWCVLRIIFDRVDRQSDIRALFDSKSVLERISLVE